MLYRLSATRKIGTAVIIFGEVLQNNERFRVEKGHLPFTKWHFQALDMEKQKKLMLLGPLKEEEKHPNFPSFHSSMEVVIFMGSIWDLRSGSLVHRFDHFGGWGNCVDNVFHPNGTQVLINAEVVGLGACVCYLCTVLIKVLG